MSKGDKQQSAVGESLKKIAACWKTRAANIRRIAKGMGDPDFKEELLHDAQLISELAEDVMAEGKRVSGAR